MTTRLAITAKVGLEVLFLTDDGQGCDDSYDLTPRPNEEDEGLGLSLVTFTTSEQAEAERMAKLWLRGCSVDR